MGRRPPGAPMVSARHLRVLRRVCELLEGTDVTWVLTGSLGLALRGVETEVHDIDVQTDAAGALELERLLAGARRPAGGAEGGRPGPFVPRRR